MANLNDEQLDQLEAILAKDLDSQSEFSMLLEGTGNSRHPSQGTRESERVQYAA